MTGSPISWLDPPTFLLSGRRYRYFFHYHNCGWPPARCTERTVELAIADRWLDAVDPAVVVEVGAVTPYYWPRRVADIIDPADPQPLVSRRCSLFEVTLSGRAVLSISTIEHIGMGQYGIATDPPQVLRALAKIFAEAEMFLLTIPVGYNPLLDDALFGDLDLPANATLRFMVRMQDELQWQEVESRHARLAYGGSWADSMAILERGGIV